MQFIYENNIIEQIYLLRQDIAKSKNGLEKEVLKLMLLDIKNYIERIDSEEINIKYSKRAKRTKLS